MYLDLILYVQLRDEVHRDVFSNREYGVWYKESLWIELLLVNPGILFTEKFTIFGNFTWFFLGGGLKRW